MPRNGSGIYSHPFPDVVEGTTIESAVFNGNTSDVEQDLNTPRPIVAGGTGASDAAQARTNLAAERSMQTVTNFDSHPWEAGSFVASPGATSAPNPASYFMGTFIGTMAVGQGIVLAYDISAAGAPHPLYVREYVSSVWQSWRYAGADQVDVAGDTMTGNLQIMSASPVLVLNKTGVGPAAVFGRKNNLSRWDLSLGNQTTESGGNVGSDFAIYNYNDAGAFIGNPLGIVRSTGRTVFAPATAAAIPALSAGVGIASPTGAPGISIRPTDGTTWAINFENAGGTQVGTISTTPTATGYNTSSDGRLKEDLKSFDAGNIVDDTNVYDFAWKSTGERSYGIIAQQANEVYPSAVNYNKAEDAWGIDYSKYVPVLLQELKALRARVATLEGRTGAKPS